MTTRSCFNLYQRPNDVVCFYWYLTKIFLYTVSLDEYKSQFYLEHMRTDSLDEVQSDNRQA